MNGFLTDALLISIRLIPVIVSAPIVFFSRIPLTIRLSLSLALAIVMASSMPDRAAVGLSLAVLAGEFMLGVVMAFGFHAAHAALDMIGKLIDTQMGLNASGVFDPASSAVTGIVSEVLLLGFALLFVALDLHHALLRACALLLQAVPPGQVSLSVLSASLVTVFAQQFLLALAILAPVILALWLTDVAFAFLSRSMPQANIYFMALPVKLAIGALMLVLSLPMVVQQLPRLFEHALAFLEQPLGD